MILLTFITVSMGMTATTSAEVIKQSDNVIRYRAGVIDFKNDKEEAEKWAETAYSKWKKDLKKEEVKSLEVLKNPIDDEEEVYDINGTLKLFGGDVTKRPIGGEEKTERYLKDLKNIEEALQRKEGKLKNALYVYKNDSLSNFANIDDSLFQNSDGTLNKEKVKELKDNITSGINNEFLICDISDTPNKKNELIKWKIEVPKGTASGHLSENNLVLDRNLGIEVKNVRIVIQKGKEHIQIDSKVVPGEKIEQRNRELSKQLNMEIVDLLNLPTNTNFLDLRFLGLSGSVVSGQSRELLQNLASQVDNRGLGKVIKFMTEKNGKLIILDSNLVSAKESLGLLDATEENLREIYTAGGAYRKETRTIIINATNSFKNGAKLDTGDLIHEFGHGMDYYVGDLLAPGKMKTISDSQGFNRIYNKEKDNLTQYGKKNTHEFFAEAYRLMHSKNVKDREFVKDNAPETYEFIQQVIETVVSI